MSSTPVILTVDDTAKTLTSSSPFTLRESVPVSVEAAALAAGTCVVTLTHLGSLLAEAELTDGTGVLDLSTDEAADLFAGLPVPYSLTCDIALWNDTEQRRLGSGRVSLHNAGASAGATLRVGGAGELRLELAANLDAGTPVMLDDNGCAAACLAANAHRYLGILRETGETGDTRPVVTAGLVTVSAWSLSAGSAYYLGRTEAVVTATPPAGYNVRPVGVAAATSTLALAGAPTVQTLADGTPHLLTWDPAGRRMVAVEPADTSAGVADADRVPRLAADGKLDATLMPDMTDDAIAAHRVQFAGLAPLNDPTGPETVALVNALLSILQTGA